MSAAPSRNAYIEREKLTVIKGQGDLLIFGDERGNDKDHGLEILVRALGGVYLPLRNGQPTGFNPLQLPETPANFEFLKIWLRALVRAPAALSAREEADLDHTLRGTLALEVSHHRLSRLIEFTVTGVEG